MTLKNIDILNLFNSITELTKSNSSLSIRTLYRLNKNLKKLNELKVLIETQKNEIIRNALTQGYINIEKDGAVKVIPDKLQEAEGFLKDLNELYDIDNKIDLELFDINELGDLELSGSNKMSILFIINS